MVPGNIGTNSAQAAGLSTQEKKVLKHNLRKSENTLRWFNSKRHHWRLHSRFDTCMDVREAYSAKRAGICYLSRLSYGAHEERREKIRAILFPKPRIPAWGPWAFPDSCLREISRRETVGTYSPTIWNYEGSGAYGIGQAKPASKMAPFGSDYMTNPWTQLKWMVYYVNSRYGGSCAALDFHNRNHWY